MFEEKFDLESTLRAIEESPDFDQDEKHYVSMQMRCIDEYTGGKKEDDIFVDELKMINPIPTLVFSTNFIHHIIAFHSILSDISCGGTRKIIDSVLRMKTIYEQLKEDGIEDDFAAIQNYIIVFEHYNQIFGGIEDIVELAKIGLVEKAIDRLLKRIS